MLNEKITEFSNKIEILILLSILRTLSFVAHIYQVDNRKVKHEMDDYQKEKQNH
jgi:hypothetical protein